MSKKDSDVLGQMIANGRWASFGKWLRLRRQYAGLTQEQAAESAGMSSRQWIRIEQGTSMVPAEKIPSIARAVNVTPGRMLVRAGYEESNDDFDTAVYFKDMLDSLVAGDLGNAVAILFRMYQQLEEGDGMHFKLLVEGTTAQDFATAAVSLNRLPTWLRSELVRYVEVVESNEKKFDYPLRPDLRVEMRRNIMEEFCKGIYRRK